MAAAAAPTWLPWLQSPWAVSPSAVSPSAALQLMLQLQHLGSGLEAVRLAGAGAAAPVAVVLAEAAVGWDTSSVEHLYLWSLLLLLRAAP